MISKRIAMARKQKSWIQTQLSEALGVSIDTVRRWEQGKRSPDADMLQKLAQALDTTTGYLLGETDDPRRDTEDFERRKWMYRISRARDSTSTNADKLSQSEHNLLLGSEPGAYDIPPESNVRFTDVTWVPVVDGAITVCCGAGTAYAEDVEWNVIGKYPVPTVDLLGFSWALKDGGFRIITVEGDSMAPRIEDGDQVLFADAELLNGDIGLVRYRGRYMIRGVFFEGGSIRLQAINKEYEPIIVPREDEDFCILGKVLLKIAIEKLNGLW